MSVRRRVQRYKSGTTSTRWFVDIKFRHPDGTVERIRQVPRVQSRVGAERLERELIAGLEQRLPAPMQEVPPVVVPSLAVFWPRFFETHVVLNNKPSEQWTKSRIMVGHLLPTFGERRLDSIHVTDIEAYKVKLVGAGYKPKTVNNHLTVLRTILRTAVQWKVIADAPYVKLLRVVRQDVVFLDFAEAETLVAAASGMWRAMISLALNTGLRIGELLALRWEDICFKKGRLRVARTDWQGQVGTPKSGQARDVPLNRRACTALFSCDSSVGLVFCAEGGGALTYRQANWALEQVAKRAGGKMVGWHTLRHTFASHLVMRGVSLTAVQQLLGHSTQAMTERYAHLTPGVRMDAVEVLDR